MKKKIIFLLLICTILLSSFVLTSCNKENAFIGTFNSTWVEGNNKNVSYKLEVFSDRTFSIKRTKSSTEEWTRTGTWAGNKSKENFGIVCFIDSENPNMYFTLTELDDGRIVASSGLHGGLDVGVGYIVVFIKN